MQPARSPIVEFYLGQGRNGSGYTHDEILAWNFDRLESAHDYIQWLFPLGEPSRAAPDSPVMSPGDIRELVHSALARARHLQSWNRMLEFYGLHSESQNGTPVVIRGARFAERSTIWLTPNNHNLLRLTRILKSLTLFDCSAEARALFRFLQDIYRESPHHIGPRTFEFWRQAVEIPPNPGQPIR